MDYRGNCLLQFVVTTLVIAPHHSFIRFPFVDNNQNRGTPYLNQLTLTTLPPYSLLLTPYCLLTH